MFLGIDLGTSAVKVVLVDDSQQIIAHESVGLSIERPHPLWSEQDPEAWWRATETALDRLRDREPKGLAGVTGIGLSGQMHGATLLDDADRVLRPAILWNDGRSADACRELERRVPAIQQITGNLVMPGFTAPKLVWLESNEPETFARVRRVLLPKDYLRLKLSGDAVSEMSDASGSLWLDVARREWSSELVEATGLRPNAMPRLVEGSEASGQLRGALAARWGMKPDVIIAGGAGDQAAGAIGAGIVSEGHALLSLGTSGVLFAAGERFAPNPSGGVHAFCHALPDRWHQMSVILSAASCLRWWVSAAGARDEAELLSELADGAPSGPVPIFLPYLSGERTPHNDPMAQGVFFGMNHDHRRRDLTRAVLEGVAFAFEDGHRVLREAGTEIRRTTVVGGGARSILWAQILSNALNLPLDVASDAEIGPALGAARLARLAVTNENPEDICRTAAIAKRVDPDPHEAERLRERHDIYRDLYARLRDIYPLLNEASESSQRSSN
jgi:xylulokinase